MRNVPFVRVVRVACDVYVVRCTGVLRVSRLCRASRWASRLRSALRACMRGCYIMPCMGWGVSMPVCARMRAIFRMFRMCAVRFARGVCVCVRASTNELACTCHTPSGYNTRTTRTATWMRA